MSFERAGKTLTGGSGSVSLKKKVGPRFVSIAPEQLPEGSFIRLYSSLEDGNEVINTVLLMEGDVLPAFTPTPTPVPPPTATPRPTRTPLPPLRPAPPSLAGYSPLLAQAASNLPTHYDFVSDGLSKDERQILDWADSRLFANPNFVGSEWGPDNWPFQRPQEQRARWGKMMEEWRPNYSFHPEDLPSNSELKLASVKAIILLMKEINVEKKSDGRHVISWGVDKLDQILDDLGVYPGLCVHCYGKTGYSTVDGLSEKYTLILEEGHVQREMLKHFAYFAKADGEGVLVRSLMDNDPKDFELLYKRKVDKYPSTYGISSFAYNNVSFMSQIRLPEAMPELGLREGTLVSYPTMAFAMVGNVNFERQAVERVYEYMWTEMIHFTGNIDEGFKPLYSPHTTTPYAPELGWILYVGQAGSPSSSGLVTGTFRALGLKAEQFRTERFIYRAGCVEADGDRYCYNGNDFLGRNPDPEKLCLLFRNLVQIDHFRGDFHENCWLPGGPPSRDRDALVALYNATDGPKWRENQNWLSDRPISEWLGVHTVGAPGERRVVRLDLHGYNLTGRIPPEIGDLDKLESLDLSHNQLYGEVPRELGDLTELTRLGLQATQLTGCLPISLEGQVRDERLSEGYIYHVAKLGLPFCER